MKIYRLKNLVFISYIYNKKLRYMKGKILDTMDQKKVLNSFPTAQHLLINKYKI